MAYACQNDWDIESLDVKTAFLYGQLNEEIYMEQPKGFKIGSSNQVYHLLCTLYGLKQATLAWNKELHKSLLKLGFKHSKSDPGVYYYQDKSGIMLFIVYVDDGLLMSNSAILLQKKKTVFLKIWEACDMGPVSEYLGFQIIHDRKKRTMVLHQLPYVRKVVKHFELEQVKPAKTPLPAGYNPEKAPLDYNTTPSTQQRYQLVIGSLLFVMLGTRPDIAFAVIKMSQFMSNPTEDHLKKALHIVKYLSTTPELALHFSGGESILNAYCDSDWAGDLEKRRLTSGYAIFLGKDLVSWHSRRQATVALSSTEAEYMSMCDCAQQILWIQSIFHKCHLTLDHSIMFGDNKGALHLAQNPVMEGQSKHIDIKYYFLRECVKNKTFLLDYVPTDQQEADLMTKNLTVQKFQENHL